MAEFKNVSFSYGEKEIIKNLSFTVESGISTAILGPSGCGKTTLLSLAAGFLKPEKGDISPFLGKASFIFQEDRLLPWKTALENLLVVNIEKERALEYLEKVGLSESFDKYPDELSGGMCRRLAIARALAFGGDVFFFDEPLRGLDIKTSAEILELIRSETEGKTVFIITHSPKEAFLLCKKIIVAGGEPFEIKAEKFKEDFSDEEDFTKFLESVI